MHHVLLPIIKGDWTGNWPQGCGAAKLSRLPGSLSLHTLWHGPGTRAGGVHALHPRLCCVRLYFAAAQGGQQAATAWLQQLHG